LESTTIMLWIGSIHGIVTQRRIAMLKLIYSTVIAAALFAVPASTQVSAQVLAQGTPAADPPADTGKAGKAKTTRAKAKAENKTGTKTETGTEGAPKAKAKTKREPTPGQLAARERQKKCGEEWRAAKAAGKLEKGATWPKFWSACNTRLKGQGT
jgi:hypothetical protein